MKLNVMVTAVGSAIGQGIIKSLKLSGLDFNLITTNTQPYAIGLYRGEVGYLVPMAKDEDFIDAIIKICNKERIDIIFIGIDHELQKFAENEQKIEKETRAKVVVSPPEVIKICNDKWLTYQFLEKNSLPCIPSALHQDAEQFIKQEGFPLVVKPRIGNSSRDVFIVQNEKELKKKLDDLLDKKEDNLYFPHRIEPIIQKYIGNEQQEYTSTAITFDGKCRGVLSMKREMKYPGHTTKALIDDFPRINDNIKRVAEILNGFGPCNFQSRVINNIPFIFEINCRFSGTTAACAQIGFNVVENTIRHIMFHEEIPEPNYKKGVILRYFNEVFIPEGEIAKVKEEGKIHHPVSEVNKAF